MRIDPRINEQAVAIERVHFVKTDKRVNLKKVSPFIYLPGRIPLLVSAPHSVRYVNKKSIKPSDEFTGSIAYLLQQLTGCHALAVAKLYGGDPDWDEPCPYKEKLAQICHEQKIRLVVDIQGLKRSSDFDVRLSTVEAGPVPERANLLAALQKKLQQAGLANVGIELPPELTPKTVVGFVAGKLAIPSVQVEINRKYRVPHQNGQAFLKMLNALVDALEYLGRSLAVQARNQGV